ncbi:FAD-dependent oxidoreductase [Subtercola boreus]|uniref:FAD-dependent oxidoreductase n=1 Tax=Subtercola boreus TaxID=120213 RepID=A0A3E0VQE4_9MICO|nr:FAD-dependent oxidoreductase [Subtercola boreus]RFA11931.1 FAD-dependent oxidoreductase [Subtercola boreus]
MNLWQEAVPAQAPDARTGRSGPTSDLAADVCIVGGGLTGLWTAYYLARAEPSLRIVVLEKETVGFGASGRNGGWCSALFPRSAASLERTHGFDAAVAMRRAMVATVAEVGRVTELEGIHCDFAEGGTLTFAMNPVQVAAAHAEVKEAARFGVDRLSYTSFSEDPARGHPAGALGATHDPACARLHPGKLVHELAAVVERLGVRIHEHTEVVSWVPGRVTFRAAAAAASGTSTGTGTGISTSTGTGTGTVTADRIVIATEAYGARLPGVGRRILPLYSLMIATEPLPQEFWQTTGIAHGNTFSDYRHLLIYGQRTADNRFAFGGRGARYHWGSSIRPSYDTVDRVFDHLRDTLVDLFPDAFDAEVTHRWGGPIGVPRDWHASASFNPRTGIAYAGGYVGDGLSTTNLAGRTLTALITGHDPSVVAPGANLSTLPWVNHLSPRWEPEPLRFLGTNLGLASADLADREERMTGRPSRTARLLGPLTGH